MRSRTAQSTAARRHLPAARAARFLFLLGALAWLTARQARTQQATRTFGADEPIYGTIGGPRLGEVVGGAAVRAGESQQNHTQITLDGWVFKRSLQAMQRDGHTLAVKPAVENLRAAPNGHVLARLVQGFMLDEVERNGAWVHVSRQVWVRSAALGGQTSVAAVPARSPPPRPARPSPAVQEPPQPVDPRRAVARRRIELFRAPDSTAIGSLEAGQPLRITARAGEWVRIEAQAWVRENEIRLTDSAILTGLSAAELRGAPAEFRGRLLRWTIQFLSLQTADELRSDFQPGQRYILARGPAPEYAFVYIIVPPERLAEVQKLEPLASVQIVARVVNGRSQYLANPILELVELQ
ncbi:MAG: hypothetical protein ACHQU8_01900 [Gemmatimonadales bacterium]